METLKIHVKAVILFFSVLMMLQSCTVYKSTPLTIEQAVQKESEVKVQWKNGYVSKYKTIIIDNENYYGVKKNNGENEKSLLDEKNISNIKEKNKILSVLSVAVPIAIIIVPIKIWYL